MHIAKKACVFQGIFDMVSIVPHLRDHVSLMKSPRKRRVSSRYGALWCYALAGVFAVGLWMFYSAGTGTRRARPSERTMSPAEQERALRDEQIQAAKKLTATFPDSDDAVYLLGLVYNDQGDSIAAMKQWERSLQLDATRADANDSLGYALLLRDDYERAEGYFRKALEIDPALATANFRLATTLVHEGKMQEAIAILEKANSLSAEGHRLLGEAYQNLKQYEKAKASYGTAMKLKPDLSEAHYGLSKIYTQLGDSEKAAASFEEFSALKKQSDEQARATRANYDTLAITKRSVAQTHTDVGRVWMMQHRHRDAEELWLRAAELDCSNALCRLQLAVLAHQSQRYEDALRYYQEVARIDPTDALVHLNLGRVSLKLNLPREAEAAFKRVVELAPDRPEGHAALAQVREILARKQ
jgi:protein O-GlcNAc transferase